MHSGGISGKVGPRYEARWTVQHLLGLLDGSVTRSKKDKGDPDYKRAFEKGNDLHTLAINSGRGSALQELGSLSWNSQEKFERYRDVAEAVVGGNAAPHIHAALDLMLLAGLKHDARTGVEWVRKTASACPESLLAGNGPSAVEWVGELDLPAFHELLGPYLASEDPLIRAFGALCLFKKSLGDPDLRACAEGLIEDGPQLRAAAAAVAAGNFAAARFGTQCTDWLMRFFNDEDEMVRSQAADCFRRMRSAKVAEHASLFEAYVKSPHFQTERTYFLKQLEDAPPAMAEFVLDLLDRVIAASEAKEELSGRVELYEVSDLILKIYASNIDHAARMRRALDLIDRLIEAGLLRSVKLDAA